MIPLRRAGFVAGIALTSLLATAVFYPIVWVFPGQEGYIVDSRTGRPIPEAVVALTWELSTIQGKSNQFVAAFESRTDEQGHYRIPGWGPRFHLSLGRLLLNEPHMLVLRRGYLPRAYANEKESSPVVRQLSISPVLRGFWLSGSTIDLIPVDSDLSTYDESITYLHIAMHFYPMAPGANSCKGDKLPLTYEELEASSGWLRERGFGKLIPPSYPYRPQPKCL
jgi:hypothetical protein